jgi:pimeloyl-ACP methyl ester carboxylesterase
MLDTTLEPHAPGALRVARLGQGEAVLLLHGYPENLQVYCELAPLLAADKQVIAFDWPGQGDSAEWAGGATPLLLARRLLKLLDDWQLDAVHLIGQDMGGQPALVFAAVYPERVRSVVVMNSLVSPEAATSWEIKWLRRFGVNRLLLHHFPWLVFQRALHTFLPRRPPLAPALRQEMWRAFRQPAVRRFIVRMCAGYEGQLPRLPAWYRQVRCPVLILWGEQDKHFPPAHAHYLHTQIPHAQLAILPGAPHWMVLSQPAVVAQRIRQFYREL